MRVLVVASALTVALVGLSACSSSSDGAADETTTTTEVEATESTETSIAAAAVDPDAGIGGGAGSAQGGGGSNGGGGQSGNVVPAPQVGGDPVVPNLVGSSVVAAELLLRDRGLVSLSLERLDWEVHRLPVGRVTAQDQIAGSTVPVGSIVTFYVSAGPQDVTLPRIVGLCREQAMAALGAVGLLGESIEIPSNDPYLVVGTYVDPQVFVRQGSIVQFNVSNDVANRSRICL